MKHLFVSTVYFVALLSLLTLTGCEDDFRPNIGIVDGSMMTVPVCVSFDRETGLDVTSRALGAQEGTAIEDISSFWMVVYNEKGELLNGKPFHIMEDGKLLEGTHQEISNIRYTGTSDNRLPEESDLGDDAAGRLEFDLMLSSARYYIYGVANVDGFEGKDISTREKLKNIECRWDSTSIARNSEMFGIFSIGQNRNASDASAVAVAVNSGKVQQLHCWLRRLASKVTVAFDGSELYDNVEVYIDTIMICDVPKMCLLGMPNHPGQASADDPETRLDASRRYIEDNGVYSTGGIDVVQKLTEADIQTITPQNYYHVCNSSHIYGGDAGTDGSNPEILTHRHSHKAQSLYFYENLQGTGKNKAQSLDGTKIDFPEPVENELGSGWKDGKAYGTYIEVRAYYRSTTIDGSVSSGWIKYRFMLGQDAKDNYDALRNTHYKVTLKLRGYANQYDWHIDYKEETGIYMTTPQFISYLYNKSMYATVKIVGELEPTYKVKAEIISDRESGFELWGPWGDGKTNAAGVVEFPDPRGVQIDGHELFPTASLDAKARGPWTSFLSLRKTSVLRIEPEESSGMQSWQLDVTKGIELLESDYTSKKKGNRTYEIDSDKIPKEDADGTYSMVVTKEKELADGTKVPTERVYRIPLYTRAKELVTKTGFTGNNPYVAYPRKMKVRFSVLIKGEKEPTTFDLDVIQVRRIVNPKGVWRKAGSSKEFEVTLLRKPEDKPVDFVGFNSIGKWNAEIMSQSDPIISLSSTPLGSGGMAPQVNARRIEGEDERPINFKINFHGAKTGYAIVRVRYHNYTCEHDIFCMVGMNPVNLYPNTNVKWMPSNVYRFEADGTAVYAENPLQEGSLFRRGSLTAITPDNNPVDNTDAYTDGLNHALNVLEAGSTTKKASTWDACALASRSGRFITWSINNKNERVADCETDYYTLTSPSGNLDFPIQKGYGVLYGEGADSASHKILEAYGYDSETGADQIKGMLGVFVYNKNTANTIFLPMGKSTHGRRKGIFGWSPGPDTKGSMRYASRSEYNTGAEAQSYTPLFLDLYRRPGALYWCQKYITNQDDIYMKNPDGSFVLVGVKNDTKVFRVERSSSFDINFFTMGFEGFSNSSIPDSGTNSDACFIRTVRVGD